MSYPYEKMEEVGNFAHMTGGRKEAVLTMADGGRGEPELSQKRT